MNLMLSNYGHRYLRERLQQPNAAPGLDEETDGSLMALHYGKTIDRSVLDPLVALSSTIAVKFTGFGRHVGLQVHPESASAIRYDELPNKLL